jgi:signal transduction histidine kinase
LAATLSIGTLVILSATVGWSVIVSRRARGNEDLARQIQQQILERALVRDEYLARREPRAWSQLEMKRARISDLLDDSATRFEDPDDRDTIGRMRVDFERGKILTDELVALLGREDARSGAPSTTIELEGRLRTEILRLAHELYSRASWLAGSASRRANETERRTMLLVIVLVGTALAGMTYNAFQSNRLLQRRIGLLMDGAERVSSGNLEHRIAIVGDDELADVARSFDAMTARLQTAYGSLEASNRELEAFSYSVSHDLRAPLRHVTGFVELLRESVPKDLDPKSVHYLDVITQAATRMGVLIDDLLAFSRSGRVEMKRGRVSLRSLIDDVVRELEPQAAGREVIWDIGSLPDVTGDESMLRQVFRNLLANAVKFTRPRTPARISVGVERARSGEVDIHVRDNGVGFDTRYASKLFQVFQRLHSTEEFEGTGIGLAVVQRVVHRHGGRVRAEGTLDGGATFWVSLPVKEDGS